MLSYSNPSIVISASSRRSGSTWLQRIVYASTDIFVWGESFPLIELLGTIFANFQYNQSVQAKETENFFSNEQEPTLWTANITPSLSKLKRANNAFFSEYYGGNDRPHYGWKEVHYGSQEIKFIHEIFPETKIILLVRNPINVIRSLAAQGWIGKYEDTQNIEMICNTWMERTREYFEFKEDPRFLFIRYEDIHFRISDILDFIGGKSNKNVERAFNTYVGDSKKLFPLGKEDEEMIVRICAKEMVELGYLEKFPENLDVMVNRDAVSNKEIEKSEIFYSQKPSGALLAFRREVLIAQSQVDKALINNRGLSEKVDEMKQIFITLQSQLAEKEQSKQQLMEQIIERNQKEIDLQTRLTGQEQAGQVLKTQVVERDHSLVTLQGCISEKDEDIARLREELALVQYEIQGIHTSRLWRFGSVYWTFLAVFQKLTFPLGNPIKWLQENKFYTSLRSSIRNVLCQTLPTLTDQLQKKLNGYAVLPEPDSFILHPITSSHDLSERVNQNDFYDSIRILPSVPADEWLKIIEHQPSATHSHHPDIICFSIIDWSSRYQRPQQLMSQFAAQGYRVFFISTSQFILPASASPKVLVQTIKENIYEIKLSVEFSPDIYSEVIDGSNAHAILDSLDELRHVFKIEDAISYVMIASWNIVAMETQKKWGWRVVYDCMDEWDNFPLIKQVIIEAELNLVKNCGLLVVTSQRLYDKWKRYERPSVLARNATDYRFYERRYHPNKILTETKHPIIGYYGAIADWFDIDLMTHVAEQRPEYTFVLLGGIFDVDVSCLEMLSNVKLLGQQPYDTMPLYLYHFDVCIIPFKINQTTDATDPVKIYEYLCGGKPVVSVALPELNSFRELLYIANNKDDFITKLDYAVIEDNPELVFRRKEFAKINTWDKRYELIIDGIKNATPQASIIVITYNNLVLTKLCLESILRNTEYPNYEIIIVDNNSTDDTQTYLRFIASQYENISIILNQTNLGFAKANNQGLARATGEFIILLNNDTIVPPGWLSRLLHYLRDPEVGMVGPVSNFVGNEAKLAVSYSTWSEMEIFVRNYTWEKESLAAEIYMLAMYCVAFRRDVFELVGYLDEQFGIGMFEDDDYSQRVRQRGYKVICARDVFVHHFGQAAFRKLIKDGLYQHIFEEKPATI